MTRTIHLSPQASVNRSTNYKSEPHTHPPGIRRLLLYRSDRNLEEILDEVAEIHKVVSSRNIFRKVHAFVSSNSHKTTLEDCRRALSWAIEEFDVSYLSSIFFSASSALPDRLKPVWPTRFGPAR